MRAIARKFQQELFFLATMGNVPAVAGPNKNDLHETLLYHLKVIAIPKTNAFKHQTLTLHHNNFHRIYRISRFDSLSPYCRNASYSSSQIESTVYIGPILSKLSAGFALCENFLGVECLAKFSMFCNELIYCYIFYQILAKIFFSL
ncbi:MAG: hypothetical protein ACI9FD_003856 [Gammaproteobacteria bacterium]